MMIIEKSTDQEIKSRGIDFEFLVFTAVTL